MQYIQKTSTYKGTSTYRQCSDESMELTECYSGSASIQNYSLHCTIYKNTEYQKKK